MSYESLVTPPTVYDYEIASRSLVLRKQQPVLGGYDPADYESQREWAVADDGTRVPISLVHRKGVPQDGSAPCLLYGYGSYEVSMDPVVLGAPASAARPRLRVRGRARPRRR